MSERANPIAEIMAEAPGIAATTPDGFTAVEVGAAVAGPALSATVLDLDRWGLRRGRELAETWRTTEIAEHDDQTVADAHGSLFEPEPRLAENPEDKQRAAWWKQLMETPEYQGLHRQTMLDTAMSQLAAVNVCDQWAEYAAAQEQKRGVGGSGEPKPEPGSDDESIEDTIARIRSTGKALEGVKGIVQQARDIAGGLGMGEPGSPLDPKALAEYFRKVKDSSFLADVMRQAGKMWMLCRSLQRRKVCHGRDDMVGIELGGDVARLVPSELAQLCCGVPELELLALARLASRQSMCREYRGIEHMGKGPIVVSVDESWSMRGERIIAAKALAISLARLARHQKRWMALVGYSGGEEGTRLALPPGRTDEAAILDWLTHFYDGGTTLDVPLAMVPRVYWPEFIKFGLARGKTDHIIITDGIVECPDDIRDRYKAWAKAEHVTTYGIVIGGSQAGDLAKVCDRIWCVDDLGMDNPATEAVLSI